MFSALTQRYFYSVFSAKRKISVILKVTPQAQITNERNKQMKNKYDNFKANKAAYMQHFIPRFYSYLILFISSITLGVTANENNNLTLFFIAVILGIVLIVNFIKNFMWFIKLMKQAEDIDKERERND